MSSLTADLCAHAVIATARAYGDDPALACVTPKGTARRALAPAVVALSNVLRIERKRACAPFGLRLDNLNRAEDRGGAEFEAAVRAAEGVLLPFVRRAPVVQLAPPPAIPFDVVTIPRGGVTVVRVRPQVEPAPVAHSIEGMILAALANGGPLNTMSLASITGRKEMVVISALFVLLSAGRVVETATPDGPRKFSYALAGPAPEAAPAPKPRDLAAEILGVLRAEPCSGGDLVEILEAPEADVRAALEALCDHGDVRAGPLTQEGWSARFFRLTGGDR